MTELSSLSPVGLFTPSSTHRVVTPTLRVSHPSSVHLLCKRIHRHGHKCVS